MSKKALRAYIIFFSALLLLGLVTVRDPFFQIKKNFTIFSEVIREVTELYVVEIEPEKVIRRGINAMLETLDPYTVLIDEADTGEIDRITTGRYAGVGIEAGVRNDQLVVIAPIDGYSAARSGIRAGDVIVSVDDVSSDELTAEDLQGKLRGEPGTKVTLKIQRFGVDEPIEFELIRERIDVKNVPWYGFADDARQIGYIQLSSFTQNAADEVREAILELREQGELKALILDLRNNPGGLLSEAVRVVDLFLPSGLEVVSTRGKHHHARQSFSTNAPSLFENKPVIVLQNEGSASSSEIVAGALQDHDRAVIIGNQSFGKGLVQIIRPLSYSLALKITTSNYYIPSGRSIQSVNYGTTSNDESREFKTKGGRPVFQETGITPDILMTEKPQNMLEIALIRDNKYFFFANEYTSGNRPVNADDNRLLIDFSRYLDDSEFAYQSRSERLLAQLEDQISNEYGPEAAGSRHIISLQSELESLRERDFAESGERIIRNLRLELATRTDGTSGRQKLNTRLDPVVLEAIKLINDQRRYELILRPSR